LPFSETQKFPPRVGPPPIPPGREKYTKEIPPATGRAEMEVGKRLPKFAVVLKIYL
jgi:hypothetical protein